MYVMSEITKKNVEKTIGMSIDDFSTLSADEEKEWIEKRTRCPIIFSKRRRLWIIGRGNPLLARKKIRTMSDLEKKSKKIFGI